jgi:hypothetical protein
MRGGLMLTHHPFATGHHDNADFDQRRRESTQFNETSLNATLGLIELRRFLPLLLRCANFCVKKRVVNASPGWTHNTQKECPFSAAW